MTITLDLPDEIMLGLTIRAAEEDLKLDEVMADLLRRGQSGVAAEQTPTRNRVRFPIVHCAHLARPGEELTTERVATILIEAGGCER